MTNDRHTEIQYISIYSLCSVENEKVKAAGVRLKMRTGTEKALNIKTSKRCLIINSYLLKNYLHKRLSICCEGVINPVLWSYLVTTYEVLLSYLVTTNKLQVNYLLLKNLFYKVFFIYLCTYSNIITAIIQKIYF